MAAAIADLWQADEVPPETEAALLDLLYHLLVAADMHFCERSVPPSLDVLQRLCDSVCRLVQTSAEQVSVGSKSLNARLSKFAAPLLTASWTPKTTCMTGA